jgi:hypothetical protein
MEYDNSKIIATDGNGGLYVRKWFISTMAILCIVVGTALGAGIQIGVDKTRLSQAERDIKEIKIEQHAIKQNALEQERVNSAKYAEILASLARIEGAIGQ